MFRYLVIFSLLLIVICSADNCNECSEEAQGGIDETDQSCKKLRKMAEPAELQKECGDDKKCTEFLKQIRTYAAEMACKPLEIVTAKHKTGHELCVAFGVCKKQNILQFLAHSSDFGKSVKMNSPITKLTEWMSKFTYNDDKCEKCKDQNEFDKLFLNLLVAFKQLIIPFVRDALCKGLHASTSHYCHEVIGGAVTASFEQTEKLKDLKEKHSSDDYCKIILQCKKFETDDDMDYEYKVLNEFLKQTDE